MKPETDTLVIFDTVVHDRPVYDTIWRYQECFVEVPAWDTVQVHHHDTTVIVLPKEVVEYRKPDYYARVSGYHPSLDYIEIYSETKIIENRVNIPTKQKVNFGVQVGFGAQYGLLHKTFDAGPYAGVGVQFNF